MQPVYTHVLRSTRHGEEIRISRRKEEDASRRRRRRGREEREQRRLMVMVASQCLSSRRRSWYIFTSSWPTCASPSLFPRGLASRDISKGSRSIVSPLASGSSLSKRGIGRLVDRPRTGSSIEQLFFFPGQRALSFRHLSPLFDSIFGAVAPLTFRLSSSQIFRSSVLYDRRYIGRCLSNVHCRRFLCVTRAYSRGRRWKS